MRAVGEFSSVGNLKGLSSFKLNGTLPQNKILKKISNRTFVLYCFHVTFLTLGRTRGCGCHTPHKVFLEFFRDELLPRPAVLSSCAPIPKTHFDTSLVKIGCCGYEI